MNEILDSIENAKTFTDKTLSTINHGLEVMPNIVKDISDRNRTSPIAFTGNRFELRALGSSANGSDAAKILNMICAYGFKELYKKLKGKKGDMKKNALVALKSVLKETRPIRFEGNNYASEWKKEAKKRKLFVVETTPEALAHNLDKECVDLFEEMNVLTKRELQSRVEVKLEAYTNSKMIEYKLAIHMVRRSILPAILDQLGQCGDALATLKAVNIKNKSLSEDISILSKLYADIQHKKAALKAFIKKTEGLNDSYKAAYAAATEGAALLQHLRIDVDEAECRVSEEFWPLASYDSLLLTV